MKFIVLVCVITTSFAAELGHVQSADDRYSGRTAEQIEADENATVLRQNSVLPERDGSFSHDFEISNGIQLSQSGSPGKNGAIISIGSFKIVHPDGTITELKFVANELGFFPESSALPESPELPFEIPDFVIRQIEFGEEQRRQRALENRS